MNPQTKYNLMFLDTETTGNTKDDYLCQVAYLVGDERYNELFTPIVPIPPEASAVHHIRPKHIEGKPAYKGSDFSQTLEKKLEDENTVFIAHNAIFDIDMLAKEDTKVNTYIDTLKVAQHLDTEDKLNRYNLQYLRYALNLDDEAEGETIQAHDALGDIIILRALFNRLFEKARKDFKDDDETIEYLIKLTHTPVLISKINFGKHAGKTIKEIAAIDKGYLSWLYGQKKESEQDETDWLYTLEQYLN